MAPFLQIGLGIWFEKHCAGRSVYVIDQGAEDAAESEHPAEDLCHVYDYHFTMPSFGRDRDLRVRYRVLYAFSSDRTWRPDLHMDFARMLEHI